MGEIPFLRSGHERSEEIQPVHRKRGFVRRKIVGEKYSDLINALYDGSKEVSTETEVTYEDGRKGSIKATLEVRDAKTAEVAVKPMEAAE